MGGVLYGRIYPAFTTTPTGSHTPVLLVRLAKEEALATPGVPGLTEPFFPVLKPMRIYTHDKDQVTIVNIRIYKFTNVANLNSKLMLTAKNTVLCSSREQSQFTILDT